MSTFVVFDSFKLAVFRGDTNFSGTYRCMLMSAGWTPNLQTSTVASLTGAFCTQLSNYPTATSRQVLGAGTTGGAFITLTLTGVIKFDLTDIAFTATSGSQLSAQYGCLYKSASQTVPMGYWQLSSAEVVGSQINITWPAAGLFETSANLP